MGELPSGSLVFTFRGATYSIPIPSEASVPLAAVGRAVADVTGTSYDTVKLIVKGTTVVPSLSPDRDVQSTLHGLLMDWG